MPAAAFLAGVDLAETGLAPVAFTDLLAADLAAPDTDLTDRVDLTDTALPWAADALLAALLAAVALADVALADVAFTAALAFTDVPLALTDADLAAGLAFAEALVVLPALPPTALAFWAGLAPPKAAAQPSVYAALGPTRKIVIVLQLPFAKLRKKQLAPPPVVGSVGENPLTEIANCAAPPPFGGVKRAGSVGVNAFVTSLGTLFDVFAVPFAAAPFVNFKVSFAPVQFSVAFKSQDVGS